MDASTIGIIAGLVILSSTLAEIIKTIIVKKMNGKVTIDEYPQINKSLERLSRDLHENYNVIQLRDQDGIPLVYTPRFLIKGQEEVIKTQELITRCQERMLIILEKLENRLDDEIREINNTLLKCNKR